MAETTYAAGRRLDWLALLVVIAAGILLAIYVSRDREPEQTPEQPANGPAASGDRGEGPWKIEPVRIQASPLPRQSSIQIVVTSSKQSKKYFVSGVSWAVRVPGTRTVQNRGNCNDVGRTSIPVDRVPIEILIRAPGHNGLRCAVSTIPEGPMSIELQAMASLEITLRTPDGLPPGESRVRLKYPQLTPADVELLPSSGAPREQTDVIVTKGSRELKFDPVIPGREILVRAQNTLYGRIDQVIAGLQSGEPRRLELDFSLSGGAVLSLEDPKGEPLSGAKVTTFLHRGRKGYRNREERISDLDGRVSLSGLVPGRYGIAASGWSLPGDDLYLYHHEFEVIPGKIAEVGSLRAAGPTSEFSFEIDGDSKPTSRMIRVTKTALSDARWRNHQCSFPPARPIRVWFYDPGSRWQIQAMPTLASSSFMDTTYDPYSAVVVAGDRVEHRFAAAEDEERTAPKRLFVFPWAEGPETSLWTQSSSGRVLSMIEGLPKGLTRFRLPVSSSATQVWVVSGASCGRVNVSKESASASTLVPRTMQLARLWVEAIRLNDEVLVPIAGAIVRRQDWLARGTSAPPISRLSGLPMMAMLPPGQDYLLWARDRRGRIGYSPLPKYTSGQEVRRSEITLRPWKIK